MVDCSVEEELCSSCQVSLAVDVSGHVLSTNVEGTGAIPYKKISSIIMVSAGSKQRCVLIKWCCHF